MKSVFQRYLLNFYWDTASESIRRVSCMAAARTGKRRYFSHPVQRAYWKSFTATNGTDGMPFGGHNTVPTRDQSQNGNPKPPNKFIVQKKPISSILSRVKNPWMHVIISQFRAKMEQISLWNGLLEMSLVNTTLFSFFLFYTCLSPT